MSPEIHSNTIGKLKYQIKQLKFVILFILPCLLVSVFTNYQLVGYAKTILITPNIESGAWVSSEAINDKYLEKIGGYALSLVSNCSPENIDRNQRNFLEISRPDRRESLKGSFEKAKFIYKRDGIKHTFTPTDIYPNVNDLSIAFRGIVQPTVGGRLLDSFQSIWVVKFVRNSATGVLEIDDAYQTSDWQNPFSRPTDGITQ